MGKKSVEEKTQKQGLDHACKSIQIIQMYLSLSFILFFMLIPETSQTLDSQMTTSALRSILFSTGSTHPKLTMATDKRETAITLSDYESSKATQYCHSMSCFLLLIYLLRGRHQIHQPPK